MAFSKQPGAGRLVLDPRNGRAPSLVSFSARFPMRDSTSDDESSRVAVLPWRYRG
jgi:hypothetical protein